MQQRPSFYSPSADLQISVFMAPKVPFHRRRNTTLTLIVYHIIVVVNVMIKIRFNIILLSKRKSLNFSLHVSDQFFPFIQIFASSFPTSFSSLSKLSLQVSGPIFPLSTNFHVMLSDQFFLFLQIFTLSRPVFPLQIFTSYFPTNVSSFSEISSHVPQPILLLFLQIFTLCFPPVFPLFFMFS